VVGVGDGVRDGVGKRGGGREGKIKREVIRIRGRKEW
jgi:hypothetical protein